MLLYVAATASIRFPVLPLRMIVLLCLCFLRALSTTPASAQDERTVLVEEVPTWSVGDTWEFRIEKDLDRTVTQGVGLLAISMRLTKLVSSMTYVVDRITDAEGERCYLLRVSGAQSIEGTYSAAMLQGETMRGSLVQESTIEGVECRRTSDLAFVRAELQSSGTVSLAGSLGGLPAPFQSHSITISNPPAEVLRFPLIEGDKWRVAATLSTTASGSTSDSIVTTFNYGCEVLGLQTITLENGDVYESVAIAQRGTQTTQSQGSGINIDDVNGTLFFAPLIGSRVRDEAESEELVRYTAGEKNNDEEQRESIERDEPGG